MLHLLLHPPVSCVCSLSGFGERSVGIIPGGFVGYHILIFNNQEKLCGRDGLMTKRCISKRCVCVCVCRGHLWLAFSVHMHLHLRVCAHVTLYTHNIHLGSPFCHISFLLVFSDLVGLTTDFHIHQPI